MLSSVLISLLAFVAAAGVLTVTPGVDRAMVLRSSTSEGPRAGVAAGLGICSGLFVLGGGCCVRADCASGGVGDRIYHRISCILGSSCCSGQGPTWGSNAYGRLV